LSKVGQKYFKGKQTYVWGRKYTKYWFAPPKFALAPASPPKKNPAGYMPALLSDTKLWKTGANAK